MPPIRVRRNWWGEINYDETFSMYPHPEREAFLRRLPYWQQQVFLAEEDAELDLDLAVYGGKIAMNRLRTFKNTGIWPLNDTEIRWGIQQPQAQGLFILGGQAHGAQQALAAPGQMGTNINLALNQEELARQQQQQARGQQQIIYVQQPAEAAAPAPAPTLEPQEQTINLVLNQDQLAPPPPPPRQPTPPPQIIYVQAPPTPAPAPAPVAAPPQQPQTRVNITYNRIQQPGAEPSAGQQQPPAYQQFGNRTPQPQNPSPWGQPPAWPNEKN
ncbi:hypothetical protein K402DRAFT_398876 [Aulographum hederae CBS 113979]|uniref:Uncharacterized protein n=1 Tax=Aulographum hederae CBS 113979 TaxID=1176131 RepID=A0A6G1GJC4_9PEZI|nr:hypothetical protein K402DRAFT_398876 [Aulographum hederae CBS 113979]